MNATSSVTSEVQQSFVAMLPSIDGRTRSWFAGLDPEAREEAVAEVRAMSWKNYLHAWQAGKSVTPSSLAYYGALAFRCGRRMAGQNSTDVLSPRTQVLGRVAVESLDALPADDGWWERSYTLEDRRTLGQPFERVRIKHDYGAFLSYVTKQEKRVFDLLAQGYGTGEMAHELNVSAPRICQIKDAIGRKLSALMGP